MKSKRKSKKWIVLSAVLIIGISFAVIFLMRPKLAQYKSINAKVGDITTYYTFSGNIETKNRQVVTSEKIMQISEIKVKEGDIIEEGALLIETTTGDEIKSKIAGEIVNITVEENEQVMGGIKLLEIVDYNTLEINVKVDEYDISKLTKGKQTMVKIGALNKEIKGTVNSMSKEGQVVNGIAFFTATIDLAKDDSLKIGMSAEVKVTSDKVTKVVTLPMNAIQFDENNRPYVLKKSEKDIAVKTEVETGINDGIIVEIKSGVSDGESILYTDKDPIEGLGFSRGARAENPMGGSN